MHRFHLQTKTFTPNTTVTLTNKEELHHLTHVLRLKNNDIITLFNGKGEEAEARILDIQSNQTLINIKSVQTHKATHPKIILACALPKRSKFELIIEKATELGVDEILPLLTKRTEILLTGERLIKKTKRYKIIAINAAKQSKRSTLPIIHDPCQFKRALTLLMKSSLTFMPSLLGKTQPIFEAFKQADKKTSYSFMIGPEGDFTPQEYKIAHEAGCIPISLGKTVLKVETAAICSISCATQFFLNNDKK